MQFIAFNRENFARLADGLAVALVVSLPWSTSATGILAVLWLLALIPTLDRALLRGVVALPVGGLPVLLVALGAIGMLWADVSWAERFSGLTPFLRLLFIPLLLHQFCRSDAGRHVLIGFFLSCVLLLAVSWLLLAWPTMPWPSTVKTPGVPVKDYIAQSGMFTVCVAVAAQLAYDNWRDGRRHLAISLIALALIFLANVLYVATSRTALVIFPIMLGLFGYRIFGWKGAAGFAAGCVVLTLAALPSATYLKLRVTTFFSEVQSYRSDAQSTSAGERLEFWKKSLGFIQQAPVIGHGTGTISDQFRRSAVGQTGMAALASHNPHNQIFAVGIQLGIVGIAALLAMWFAHLLLFRSGSFAAWVGLVVVVQNVVGSLFNSHLFDFTQGWGYVFGVGIAGGIVLKEAGRVPKT
jgi:O-antigen ligase